MEKYIFSVMSIIILYYYFTIVVNMYNYYGLLNLKLLIASLKVLTLNKQFSLSFAEDVLGAARQIEKVRQNEGSISEFEKQSSVSCSISNINSGSNGSHGGGRPVLPQPYPHHLGGSPPPYGPHSHRQQDPSSQQIYYQNPVYYQQHNFKNH